MGKNLIILAVGIAIGYFILKKNAIIAKGETIKPGDKGKNIEGMQKAFEKIAGLKFDEYGVYDVDTLEAVNYLLKGTTVLKDAGGVLDKNFSNDLSRLYYNSQTN